MNVIYTGIEIIIKFEGYCDMRYFVVVNWGNFINFIDVC